MTQPYIETHKAKDIPLITFAEAEQIGQEMHDRFVANDVTPPLTRDDMDWADMVQFVIRRANEAVMARAARH